MRPRGAWKAAALLASLWATPLLAKDEPDVHVTAFPRSPDFLSYFENSDVILFQDIRAGVIYRSDDAGNKWAKVDGVPEGEAARLVMHEFDPNRAYILTEGIHHYRTHDRGKTWQVFVTDSRMSVFEYEIMMFHASDPDRIIFNGMDCETIFCDEVAMYTTDGFRTAAKYLRVNTAGCWWAKSSVLFTTGQEDLDTHRILCIVRDDISPFKQDQRLFVSDDYFSALDEGGVPQEFEPDLDMTRAVRGIVNVAAVKKYLMVATTSVNTDEMALFVTDDTIRWHRAMFPTDHRVNQEAYTVLESTNYSIQIDVMTTRPSNPMGVMFTSNSNGTFFTRNIENTNRNGRGHVDFEKIAGIQGIFLVNKVRNSDEVMRKGSRADKEIITEITFDDGRTFSDVKDGKERLHLHSVTDLSNVGRVFSSPAPGLVMGVGNTGDVLGPYEKGHLYVSDDAGATWSRALEGPHKYEFGDQGSILVAVADVADEEDAKIDEFSYSLDHGKTWKQKSFPEGLKIAPWILTTTQDSTSLKFIIVGRSKDGKYHIIAIDFDGLHEATCKPADLEKWWARVDENGKATCLMGHTQSFERRKKDAACFLKKEFQHAQLVVSGSACTDVDFECDFNFRRKGDECVRDGPVQDLEGACKGKTKTDTFKGSSGWRLIPGNTCDRGSGKQKDELEEHKCEDSSSPPPPERTDKVAQKTFAFEGEGKWDGFEVIYLERGDTSSTRNDESIIARPINLKSSTGGKVYVTHDHGKTWTHPSIFNKNHPYEIIPHQYFKEMVFFIITGSKTVVYTLDHGKTFHEFEAPDDADVSAGTPLAFHPDRKDWLIWMGKHCESGGECFIRASYSKDRGDNWATLKRYAPKCEFIGNSGYKYRNQTQVLCIAYQEESNAKDNPKVLATSTDWFDDHKETPETHVKDFATMAEFIFVATEDSEHDTLRASTSIDGRTYAEARFPTNFRVPHQHAYTVLDSSTHAVNVFVATSIKEGRRFGAILKSNSNGTDYALSLEGVNCDESFFVDYEKMLGLEGVALANVVANREDEGAEKKLQSRISHNDGAAWGYLQPPAADVDGKAYGCQTREAGGDCALHIHGYTARQDKRKTYSSEGAIGLMFGVGNVGPALGDIKDADTFMTTDAGITWKNVKKGEYAWQYGDQGSIVILVKTRRHGKTKTVSYTTDEGATWVEHEFNDREVEVVDVTTLRSGASRNFLVWCRDGDHMFAVNLDFSGLTDRACKAYDKDDADPDYRLWSPEHPLMKERQCLFGHKSEYLRKKTDKTCFNGFKMEHLYNVKNCTCTRMDYEW